MPVLVLTLIFVLLKTTEQVDWPWLWVLSPLWLPATVILVVTGLIFVGVAAYFVLEVGVDLIRQAFRKRR